MRRRLFIVLPLLLLTALMVFATSVLAQTPAGTQIRNRSSATYEDTGGNSFTAQSNEVITVVLPVFGVSVLPDDSGETPPVTPAMTQQALAGQTVTFRYDLTNTGNDNDSFTLVPLLDVVNTTMALALANVTIYHDLNGNGAVDVGEPVISSGGAPGNLGPIGAGGSESIIVSYQVPGGATAGQVAYVGVDATSIGDAGQVDTRNYHLTSVVNDAVLTANLIAAPATVFIGQQITYTLSGSNTGNNTANGQLITSVGLTGVLQYDIIPLDSGGAPLPIFGTPSGTPAGGTVLYLPAGSPTAGSPETWLWSTTAAAGDIAVGYVTNGAIVQGQSYNFAYQATVPAGMSAGVLNNTASIAFTDNDGGTPDPTIVVSNNAAVTIGVTAVVLVGPLGAPGAGTPPNFNDDVQTIASASAGTNVDFVSTVRNDGNSPDQINILRDGASTIPGTWGVIFLQSDGITPLVDTGIDGIPDVGPVAPGASIDFVVRLVIPGSQPVGGPFDAVVRAQSTNDPLVSNLTTDRITTIIPAGVDIGNYDGVAGTTNQATVDIPTNPGTFVDFALDVINPTGATDTYTLTDSLPAGWTSTFYTDANNNGVLDPAETTPVAAAGPIGGGLEVNVIVRVNVPAGEAPATYGANFRATSTNNAAVFNIIANTVTVNSAPAVNFAPDLAGTTTPGGTISYSHTVTNTGNQPDTFDLTYLSSNGFTYVFLDVALTSITTVTLAPGANATVIAQLTVPAGTPVGTIETGTLTATGQAFPAATDDAIDVTTVGAGDLSLTKSVNPPTDQPPGTDLTYTTDYQNLGTGDLTNIVVVDPVPAFTDFQVGSETVGAAPGIGPIVAQFSDDGGTTWTYVPASAAGGAPVGYDRLVTNIRWVLTGTLVSGASSTTGVGFVVQIQ